MALAAGTKLGPYELSGALGAGGMGEVYRARDPRLKREVAIKILPASFSSDAHRLRRFEHEAHASAALNHPNILAIYDVGTENGTPYIVSELLEGETLRTRLRAGSIPIRKAVDYALQIARGLSAAHDKGIVHRDLKPENILITRGQVKILDFGLAKLTHPEPGSGDTITRTFQSAPGTVLGTLGYISPEQARGKVTDARSDLFAFGAILYEMLSGRRAFQGEAVADAMSAILHQDPPDLAEINAQVPTALEHIVRHCLEKNPAERFQSARDIAFDLEMLSSLSSAATVQAVGPAVVRSRIKGPVKTAAVIALAVVAGILIGRKTIRPPVIPTYQQMTFRRGTVRTGRFAPGGQVVYAAAWESNPAEVFTVVAGGRASTTTGIRGADVEAISADSELLLVINRTIVAGYVRPGTLARAPMSGAAPRPIMEGVQDADWSPDGSAIAVAHYVGQRFRLEYPIGTVLYETDGWINYPRISPRGDMVAFLDHPLFGDDAGNVVVIDLAGHRRMTSPKYASTQALAWTRSGEELWFSAATTGIFCDIYGVNLAGKVRTVARAPGGLRLLDIGPNGNIIAAQGHARRSAMTLGTGEKTEQDLGVADWSVPSKLSNDGSMLLLEEQVEGTQNGAYSVYLRKMDGSPPLKLGEGNAEGLSPDGKWALAGTQSSPRHLVLLPIGAGEVRPLTHNGIQPWSSPWRAAEFLNDQQIVFSGNESGHSVRVWVQAIDGGNPRAITPEGVGGLLSVSPDRKQIAISGQQIWVLDLKGGDARIVPGTSRGELAVGWSGDGHFLFVHSTQGIPRKLFRIDIATGQRELAKQFAPADTAGLDYLGPVIITPDARFYSYGFIRNLTDMYSIEGLN